MNDRAPERPTDILGLLAQVKRPPTAVITAGMPYANGPLHLGHLAGAHIPADIYARFMRMLIGPENVLFVCGTDDHGSTSELAALHSGKSVREFIDGTHELQKKTLDRYNVSLDTYSGTSSPECFDHHKALAQNMLRKLFKNEMLDKKVSKQWFDPKLNRFLQDRFVKGRCPNPKCDNESAYSDECDKCGTHYDPTELINPKSALSDSTPVLKDTAHWWLNMATVAEPLRQWIQTKEKLWRKAVFQQVYQTVLPALVFQNSFEESFKSIRPSLPKHNSRYAPGKRVVVQFETGADFELGQKMLGDAKIDFKVDDAWAHRSITRDVTWGIPVPADLDPAMQGKTLYVWPDSLIAPISFTTVALAQKKRASNEVDRFWRTPGARVYQFLGQDNVYFYVLMQGALWLGSQTNPLTQPSAGDLQMTDIFGCYHLMVDGEKMSKSKGNFFTGDQLLDEKGYQVDQLRYYLALLSLPEKASNFDFANFDERNKFLAGPLNAAFEKPISACHSKFDGKIPSGSIMPKVQEETFKIVQKYLRSMERAEYSTLLFAIENYARQINSLFTQFKPHDDRAPLNERNDALYSCFYVLKNLMIMLYPFVPQTMHELRKSLNLPESALVIDQLGTTMAAGHEIGTQGKYFEAV
jgi:methionyl-tRNA synthetase